MKRLILAFALLSIPAWVQAEPAEESFKYNGNGYTFFSSGSCQHLYTNLGVGGGAEGFVRGGFAVGVDAGYYRFVGDGSSGFGILSVNPGYHFVDRTRRQKLDPFVYGGLGFGAAGGVAVAVAAGGGVNYWFSDHVALRVSGQQHGFAGETIVTFRIGLSFR